MCLASVYAYHNQIKIQYMLDIWSKLTAPRFLLEKFIFLRKMLKCHQPCYVIMFKYRNNSGRDNFNFFSQYLKVKMI